jgi:hypothetical protein
MSKTLKLDTLKEFKPKGVNVDQSIIDNALKEFVVDENVAVVKALNNKALKTKTPIVSTDNDLDFIKSKYEQKIALLEKKVEVAESQNKPLTKNEEKLLSAIRSEQVKQGSDWPVISTNKLRKMYKVHPAYFARSLETLTISGVISREETAYSGSIKTYKYTILK